MSKSIKIRSPTRKLKMPQIFYFSSPFSPPDGRIRKTTLSSQFVQLLDTPTNFHCLSTSGSTKLLKALNPTP